ncbi:MAG: hypothetical protein JO362_02450 [Streptomycetaceae bacterium]|nr:hypothetical protein [Streptomycetaceae bacterium]
MQIHRTQHQRCFTVLPNTALQDRQLSYTARGLLADLLSRKDGWREDGRQMADSSPQGRGAIRKALKELTEAGYYRVDKIRMPDGTIRSEAHVFDTPQLALPVRIPAPDATRPALGEAAVGPADTPPVKEPVQIPSLPAGHQTDEADEADEEVRAAVAMLFRVIRPEPRLRLGQAEAAELAPLVAQWLERGSTPGDLAQALLPGLPPIVHAPVALLRNRLERKMPPTAALRAPVLPRPECEGCHDPAPRPGLCRACAGLGPRVAAVSGTGAAVTVGAARVRAALRATKTATAAVRGAHSPTFAAAGR